MRFRISWRGWREASVSIIIKQSGKTKDGKVLTISLTVSPIRNDDGIIVGASKVARDITERETHERALERANAVLLQANADLQQFAYSASHDLQEPLRMVSTFSELLKREFGSKLGPVADEYIGYTLQGALRMEQLLSDLRELTHSLPCRSRLPWRTSTRGGCSTRLWKIWQQLSRKAGASITRSDLPHVRLHEFQMEQLFQNLIGNAIRYRSKAPPQIHVAAHRRGPDWIFSVQDNGIGIEPEYKEQIFGLFKRLHSVAAYPGTGMGLAICKTDRGTRRRTHPGGIRAGQGFDVFVYPPRMKPPANRP